MGAAAVLILKPNGEVAEPVSAADLVNLASEATLAAALAELGTLRKAATKIHQVTVDLTAAKAGYVVPLGTLTTVQTVVVKTLTGATATLKFGGLAESAIPLLQDEVRDGLAVAALYLDSPGGVGASLVLELHGR